ncbi:MAG: NAD(P)(+) transhydrogenase (Re/Si-specific) subunit beta [Chloroflexi bacterium]|nr:MAG: NAD(P)(+) transhydrogenase (Re/Si-specific) subunit beta [Chloroflexota bacterium]
MTVAITLAYLLAAVLFILGLKQLSSPKGARNGNFTAAAGMVVALGATVPLLHFTSAGLIITGIGIAIGGLVGTVGARMVRMTAIPQMVALFNGVGGGAAALVAVAELLKFGVHPQFAVLFPSVFSIVIGSISFAGSAVAFAKLQELMTGTPITYPGAVAASGFTLNNFALIVAGTLVGASGSLLTKLMSDAMGRSLGNVLFGAFGQAHTAATAAAGAQGRSVRSASAEDLGTLLAYSQRVIIVPGYGLAVAQAQHAARELADVLEKRGVDVEYAIHPVAGRMPGHMNVLLAEANVPYEQLKEMDQVNDDFKNADVALIVGANDVVNPAARNTPGSPIYGMPILNADQAKNIIFMKRSMRPGFAGIDNDLMFGPNTVMFFGDAKDSLTKLVSAVKAA